MTAEQQKVLALINKLNAAQFAGWFAPSTMMALVQIESGFNPTAYRREPSGLASYGLCQVLDETATGMGLRGSPTQMYDPQRSLTYGMKYMRQIWDALAHGFHRDPTLTEWCDAYNEGPGNVLKGRKDAAYSVPWLAAKAHWAALVDGVQPSHSSPAPHPAPVVDSDNEADALNRAELNNPNPGLL